MGIWLGLCSLKAGFAATSVVPCGHSCAVQCSGTAWRKCCLSPLTPARACLQQCREALKRTQALKERMSKHGGAGGAFTPDGGSAGGDSAISQPGGSQPGTLSATGAGRPAEATTLTEASQGGSGVLPQTQGSSMASARTGSTDIPPEICLTEDDVSDPSPRYARASLAATLSAAELFYIASQSQLQEGMPELRRSSSSSTSQQQQDVADRLLGNITVRKHNPPAAEPGSGDSQAAQDTAAQFSSPIRNVLGEGRPGDRWLHSDAVAVPYSI